MMKHTLLLLLSAVAIATPALAFSASGVINARKTVIQNEQQRQKDVIVMRNLRDVADWADYGGYGGYDGYGERMCELFSCYRSSRPQPSSQRRPNI